MDSSDTSRIGDRRDMNAGCCLLHRSSTTPTAADQLFRQCVGLALSEKKIVCATLQNHYGKSCRKRVGSGGQMTDKPIAKFRIRGGGIDDV